MGIRLVALFILSLIIGGAISHNTGFTDSELLLTVTLINAMLYIVLALYSAGNAVSAYERHINNIENMAGERARKHYLIHVKKAKIYTLILAMSGAVFVFLNLFVTIASPAN